VPEKVLVVDDEPHIVEFVSEFLEDSGYVVRGLSDPQTAVALFESFAPDVCVIDIRMPYILGSELMGSFKQIDPTVGIIFLTAQTEVSLAIDLMKQGASDYFMKPVDLYQLSASVRRALEHQDSREGRKSGV
jgi:DNA-binding NtrC family response regulator